MSFKCFFLSATVYLRGTGHEKAAPHHSGAHLATRIFSKSGAISASWTSPLWDVILLRKRPYGSRIGHHLWLETLANAQRPHQNAGRILARRSDQPMVVWVVWGPKTTTKKKQEWCHLPAKKLPNFLISKYLQIYFGGQLKPSKTTSKKLRFWVNRVAVANFCEVIFSSLTYSEHMNKGVEFERLNSCL